MIRQPDDNHSPWSYRVGRRFEREAIPRKQRAERTKTLPTASGSVFAWGAECEVATCQTHRVITLRPFQDDDWPGVWAVLEPIFRAGETYAYPTDISEQAARGAWIDKPVATYVAVEGEQLLGTYYLIANQPGRGAHVCNCGYAVAEPARGRGIATRMCEHSQAEAIRLGFRAMQYNLVASSNHEAVRLWEKLGFAIVGTLPGAFHHPALGYVDAHVMFKNLVDARPG